MTARWSESDHFSPLVPLPVSRLVDVRAELLRKIQVKEQEIGVRVETEIVVALRACVIADALCVCVCMCVYVCACVYVIVHCVHIRCFFSKKGMGRGCEHLGCKVCEFL